MTNDPATTALLDLGEHFKPGNTCHMGDHVGCPHPEGATLWLGGTAWAHPALTNSLTPVETLTPYPGNPRRGDQDAITASVRDLGIYKAQITYQTSTGHVLTGNHTLRALLDLDAELAPATAVDVSDARGAAIVARDNRTSDLGVYDDAELLALLTADEDVLALSGYAEDPTVLETLQRNADYTALVQSEGETGVGELLGDVLNPIDLDGSIDKITVTLDSGHRTEFYAHLKDLTYVRNVASAYSPAVPADD